MRQVLNAGLDEVFERYDAILTPASTGFAPKGLESTGSPVFNALWTYCGVPCVSLPLLDVDGLPLGVQLVGPHHDDGRLLRTANWLVQHLAALAEE
jgi:Asp-tRNA(Asn)/Glu-tRNA(Gln) amidotransferase A subunit family amidase